MNVATNKPGTSHEYKRDNAHILFYYLIVSVTKFSIVIGSPRAYL